MADKQFLEWHGSQWRVRVKVPSELRAIFGKGKITVPLHTDSLAKANSLKWAEVAKIKANFAAAKKGLPTVGPLMVEAAQLRLEQFVSPDNHRQKLQARVADLADHPEVLDFAEVASGTSTPITAYLEAFKKHKAYRVKSAGDLERVLGWLEAWLKKQRNAVFVEEVHRKLAGRFLEEVLLKGRSVKKVQSYLGFLREYWKWLKQRGHAEENPWLDQDLPRAPRRTRDEEPDKGKRGYTDDELAKLLYGPAKDYMPDLMRVAALSGMRIEEICQLRVSDCADDNFHIWQGKTANAIRDVPIHSGLVAVVERRSQGKKPEDFLFHELPETPETRDTRSDPASKRFTRYRRLAGVDERPNDKAKSNVDFHSFRRTFIRMARDALSTANGAFTPWTLADVVGHDGDDDGIKETLKLTMKHYPGPSSADARRACVEAVKLPGPTLSAGLIRERGTRPTFDRATTLSRRIPAGVGAKEREWLDEQKARDPNKSD